ncbi:restriction endonuclease subunit S, partial [Enterococcus devriesei]|uniref:restriction endonuclease subunit S n=1 Tax=Enterococcus devriesei TaxID=319970 RepID=UPI00406BC49F
RKLDLFKKMKQGYLEKMFPKNGVQVPELRFAYFIDVWEQRKFKEFSKKQGRKNSQGLDFPAYSVSNKVGLIAQTDQFDGSRLDDLEKSSYKFVEPNEFAYNPARINVGSIAFNNLDKTVIVSSLYVVVKMSDDLDNEFILQYIKSPIFIKEVRRNTEGSVREYLFYENFSNIKVPYTKSIEEQKLIGKLLRHLDNTIALHQRKLDLFKKMKQGYLEKMFPKNGVQVPELRFAYFKDVWEQSKLGIKVNIIMGQSPNSENYTENPDDYILVQGNADMKNGYVVPRVWTTQITKQAQKGDLILSVRAPVGDIGKTDYDVVIGRGVAAIRGNEFIFQQLGKMKTNSYWSRYSTGSTFESINSNDIKEATIMVPSSEEQEKIGVFLSNVDYSISLQQNKLDQLKFLKSAFLKKMFI